MSPTPDDRWYEAVVRVDARDADLVADVFVAQGAAGVAIEPAIHIRDDADFAYDERTDAPWTVRATFAEPFGPDEQLAVRDALTALTAPGVHAPLAGLEIAEVQPVDWAEEWKQFYRLRRVGQHIVIRPSWEAHGPAEGDLVISLDPGAAFGTGEHETTRLCLEALERHFTPGRVLDVGAGSGVLAVAAAMMGADEVRAVDIDADTVRVARENAERNGVADAIDFVAGSLGADWPWPDPPEGHDLVLANISSTVIGALAADLARAVRPGGLLIASGFLLRDADEVRGTLGGAGLTEVDFLHEAEWGCLVARRPAT